MLPNPGTPANVIAFHPYNPKIVVAGNNRIKMWDIEQGNFKYAKEFLNYTPNLILVCSVFKLYLTYTISFL